MRLLRFGANATVLTLPPALALVALVLAWRRDDFAVDFAGAFLPAADAVRAGVSPYLGPGDPGLESGLAYVYPPLASVVLAPVSAVAGPLVEIGLVALLAACAAGTLVALGVRDRRCVALVLAWPPLIAALQTGNLTIPLALAAALAWRWRERPLRAGVALGLALALKPLFWPLVLVLAAARRGRSAGVALAVGLAASLVSWAAIGFEGLADYPALVRSLAALEARDAYTLYAVALDLGVGEQPARALWLLTGVGVLALALRRATAGREREAFALAVVASLALSPIVWLHYLWLLVVPVALRAPRLGVLWFAPLLLWLGTGDLNGAPWQTAAVLSAAAATAWWSAQAPRAPDPGRGAALPGHEAR